MTPEEVAQHPRWKELEPLACRIHDAAVTAGSDEIQGLAFDWYQATAGQTPCPVCCAIFEQLIRDD